MDSESYGVMIVDADSRRAAAMSRCLQRASGLSVTREIHNTAEALRIGHALSPDAALVCLPLEDYETPVLLCRDLQALSPSPEVLLYGRYSGTGRDELAYLLSGARGFVSFGLEGAEGPDLEAARSLVTAVQTVLRGDTLTEDLLSIEDAGKDLASLLRDE